MFQGSDTFSPFVGEKKGPKRHPQHPGGPLLLQHWAGRTITDMTPQHMWVCPLPRSGSAVQSCQQLSAAQHKEPGADVSSGLSPSSGCIENSSWTPSWASRQVAGTQPCSSDVLTNHQPEKKTGGSSVKGSQGLKTASLPPNHEPG